MPIEPVRPIKFDERPALTFEIASEQLEHLYVNIQKIEEKLNEVIEAFNKHTHKYRDDLLMKDSSTSKYDDRSS